MSNPHTMSIADDGTPTFTCTEPQTAYCHVWADCMTTDGCESGDANCTHEKTQHADCIYADWYGNYLDPQDVIEMYLDEHGELGSTPPAGFTGPVTFEWDEIPLWQFDVAVLPETSKAGV